MAITNTQQHSQLERAFGLRCRPYQPPYAAGAPLFCYTRAHHTTAQPYPLALVYPLPPMHTPPQAVGLYGPMPHIA